MLSTIFHRTIKDCLEVWSFICVCITPHIFIRYNIDRNMLTTIYLFIFFVSNAMRSESTVFKSQYVIKTIKYPKTSCHRIANIRSKSKCVGTCATTMDMLVMISHDEYTKTCMCCNEITGSDIIGPNWRSYVPCKYLFFYEI